MMLSVKTATMPRKQAVNAAAVADLWQLYWHNRKNQDARNAIVEQYLPLVIKVVRQMAIRLPEHVDPRELIGSGVEGLYQALNRFDPERGIQFDTFAEKRICGAVLDDLRARDPLTRGQRQAVRTFNQAVRDLSSELGRIPTDTEMAQAAGISEYEVAELQGLQAQTVSIDAEAADGFSFAEVLCDPDALSPRDEADAKIAREALTEAIPKLSEPRQKLLFMRHHEELGVNEIAAVLGVTAGRVSQMYKETVKELRRLLKVEL